ncbi:MAG TPA: uracil permease [Melioribacteraceae bacterium]|nr:uracil permease [Melioribacteraceae bacterium]
MKRQYIGINEKIPILKALPLSFQHLTAMFGATILVPIIIGIDPAIVLLMNGIGTIIYSYITKSGIPAYLGSSFAFISPTLLIIAVYGNFSYAQSGYIFFGLFFIIISYIVKYYGLKWIDVVMPPVVMGSIVAIIGLELAPIAAQQAGFSPLPTPSGNIVPIFSINYKTILVSSFTLLVGVFGSLLFKGFLQVIPILTAVISGYVLALLMGLVDFSIVEKANWIVFPTFHAPIFNLNAIIIIAPACLVVLTEHISHLIVTGKITNQNLMKNPGLEKSLLGDGISNVISGFAGSTPNTTYGENIGVMAITQVYSVYIIRIAALIAILFSCIGKFSALISSIPTSVMGGITILLYGVIAVQGFRIFVEQNVDFSKNKNMVLGAVTIIAGVSNATINIGSVQLKGMALAAILGILLSIVFYILERFNLLNE